ncbi:MAG TPA: hypothetical protein VLH38_02550 [Patescibacteria group bacterium]|nr:hypothetical protein [Patescibacteria group bacterium]
MRYIGLLSSLFLVAALFLAEVKWGPDYRKTFSRLVAQRRASILYYFIVFSLFLVAFSIFIIWWFIPHYKLTLSFTALYAIGAIAQGVCITVPEVGGKKTKIHLLAAGIMSASTVLQMLLILLLIPLKLSALIVGTLSTCIMLTSWLGYIFNLGFIKQELAVQSLYFAGYLITIIVVSFTS